MPNNRVYNWTHNSLLGSASRSYRDFYRIQTAPSATPKAKDLATEIIQKQQELYRELKAHRVNEDGTITEGKTS